MNYSKINKNKILSVVDQSGRLPIAIFAKTCIMGSMKQSNRYILITKTGRTMVFSVGSVADLYLSIYGGTLTILQPSGQELAVPLAIPANTCILQSIL
jgi:hypothetical protein